MRLLKGEAAGKPCRVCGRVVAPRAIRKHLRRIRTTRFAGGRCVDVLADHTYGASRWCDGSPEGVKRHEELEQLRRPVLALGDVWEQVAGLWVSGRGAEAAAFASKALEALARVGIRPR